MESLKQKFLTFLEDLNPEPLLSLGNETIENISQVSQQFSSLTHEHISCLLKYLFQKCEDHALSNPFFACQILTLISNRFPEIFFKLNTLQEIQSFFKASPINDTSAGYIYQVLRPVTVKKNIALAEVFLNNQSLGDLVRNVRSPSVADFIKDLFTKFPERCCGLFISLMDCVLGPPTEAARDCAEVIADCIQASNTLPRPGTDESCCKFMSELFCSQNILRLVNSVYNKGKLPLIILSELLKLPMKSSYIQTTVRIISESINTFTLLFKNTQTETRIDLIKVITLVLKSNLGLTHIYIGDSEFIPVCTDFFFEKTWISILHNAYYEFAKVILNSNSNILVSTVIFIQFMQAAVPMLVFSYNFPNICYKNSSFRKGFMGHVTKIGALVRDSKLDILKNYLASIEGWKKFIIYISAQENIETGVLGGRTRYKPLTETDLEIINNFEDPLNVFTEEFSDCSYWSIPVPEI